MRTFVAFLGAPVIPAIVAAWVVYRGGEYQQVSLFVFVCLFFYAVQAVVGIPAYILMNRKELHRVWMYAFIGFLGGGLPLLFLVMWRHAEKAYHLADYLIVFYPALLGAGTGLMFWILARAGRRVPGRFKQSA